VVLWSASLACWPAFAQVEDTRELLLGVTVNGKSIGDAEPVLEAGGMRYFVTADVLQRGRLKIPAVSPVRVEGMEFYLLDAISGARATVEASTQMLMITVPASAFIDTILDEQGNLRLTAMRPEPGLFLNHDFQVATGGGRSSVTGLVEGGFFSKFGTLTNQYLGRDLTGGFKPLRLSTQLTRDFPEAMTTLTLGDTISASSPWGRSVYYAGVRWASKFSTQPAFIPMVLPSLAGQAAQQSTVDVYVDNMKRLSRQVEPGPFMIQNIPVIAGQGDIRMVVTDLLGRQQVITTSYLRGFQILRKGVQEFTYEGGTLRRDYGAKSNAYESFFASATQRRGLTDRITLEGRAEVRPGIQTLGLGASYAMRGVGIVSAGAAGSQRSDEIGRLIYAEFSHNRRTLSFAGRMQRATQDFQQLGMGELEQATRMMLQGQVSKTVGDRGNLAVGYLRRDGRTESSVRALTASFNHNVGRGQLSVGGTYALDRPGQYGVNVSYILRLGDRKAATATVNTAPSGTSESVEINRTIPVGPGYGYRVQHSTGAISRTDANLFVQTMQGRFGMETTQTRSGTFMRFSERSSLVFMRNHILPSQWLNDSFGMVEVDHGEHLPVFVNNQRIATTNGKGVALLPWLVPYNQNQVRLDGTNLPADVNLDLQDRMVVPMARSGVFLKYTPLSIGGATLILHTADGKPVPLGAMVTINALPGESQVVLHGEVFVTDIAYPAMVRVTWESRECVARIDKAPEEELLPRIGPLVCVEQEVIK
jgi:outer membrane usher protein